MSYSIHAREPKSGHEDASGTDRLESLVREHRSVLLSQVLCFTSGDYAFAEDVVQETFLRAWRRIDRMSPEHGSVRGWLMRVAHNVAVDGYRARRAVPVGMDASEMAMASVDDATSQVEADMVFRETLAVLPATHRVVLEAMYLRDWTAADVARELGLPVGTVKSRVFYGVRRLRAAMASPAVTGAS